ncbi:MAG TPA: PKD domain-containing protein [Bacteroidales bacterium]|nr:PKD domain-containing protein [Bacteroidales bacterium]
MSKMKLAACCLLILVTCNFVSGQERPNDAYLAEENGYFINVKPAFNGYVFTDNYCNTLYYLENGNLQTLISSPGCGRYYNVSSDGKYIAYKHINSEGQAPAVINLVNGKTEYLNARVDLCGQPLFTAEGIAFTIYDKLIVLNNGIRQEYPLGYYSNIIAISPDESMAVYSDNDRLMLLDIESGKSKPISEENKLSSYPQFSPDGKKVLFQSENMFVLDLVTEKMYDLGYGLYPKWLHDSETVIFYNTDIQNNTVINSDVYKCNYLNPIHINVTNTEERCEMQAVETAQNEIVYHSYSDREIYKLNIGDINISDSQMIYKHEGELEISFQNIKSQKAEVYIPGQVPYTHQVYDTPDAHYGYGSCAPTCAIMAISYFNILPKWSKNVTKLYPHTSDYGYYVSTKYRLNEHYYEESATTSGGDVANGGYGYMWAAKGPNGTMRNYMQLHYMESSQLWSSSVTWAGVTNEIDLDYPLPMCAMLSSAGHLVLTQGYIVGQHTLMFSEPYGDKNTPSWPSYDGYNAHYDWPGYNNGYQNLDYNGSYGIIAWTVTARTQEVEYNDTLIDDVYYHHGFEMNNTENGSQMRYFRDENTGYNNHFWWTITEASSNDICWVRWIPNLEEEGYYRISAYIPAVSANAHNAPYRIIHGVDTTKVLINQNDYNNEWVDLGIYKYTEGDNFWVYLGDSTGTGGDSIAYDAIRFSHLPKPVASFTVVDNHLCVDENVILENSSSDALSFSWNLQGSSNPECSETNPEISYSSAGSYDIQLIAYGIVENDTLELLDYFEIHNPAIADFTVNSYELYLPNAIAIFQNNSQNADSYFWDFGNGSTSTDSNPYCVYNAEGSYSVSLTASNDWCPESLFVLADNVVVNTSTNSGVLNSGNVYIYPNPANDFIVIKGLSEISQILIRDVLGQIVFMSNDSEIKSIDVSSFANGIYMMELVSVSEKYIRKIIVER